MTRSLILFLCITLIFSCTENQINDKEINNQEIAVAACGIELPAKLISVDYVREHEFEDCPCTFLTFFRYDMNQEEIVVLSQSQKFLFTLSNDYEFTKGRNYIITLGLVLQYAIDSYGEEVVNIREFTEQDEDVWSFYTSLE